MAGKAALERRPRRWGSGTAAIVRLLVAAREPMTQVAIAGAAGVTQPRVSQVLKHLAEHDIAPSKSGGYSATQRARMLDLYVSRSRPALTRPEVPWYGTAALHDQVRAIVQQSRDRGVRIAVSADIGPALLVPSCHPKVAVVYARRAVDLTGAQLVATEGRADASVLVRVTDDASLLRPFPPWPLALDGIPLADPVQQWRDLLDLGGDDRREAADRLRKAILDHTLTSSHDRGSTFDRDVAPHTTHHLRQQRDAILDVAARRGAHNIRVFGSVATGRSHASSDVDLLVDMEPGRSLFDLGGLQMDLQELLGVGVDVVTEHGLRPAIRTRVLAEAVPL